MKCAKQIDALARLGSCRLFGRAIVGAVGALRGFHFLVGIDSFWFGGPCLVDCCPLFEFFFFSFSFSLFFYLSCSPVDACLCWPPIQLGRVIQKNYDTLVPLVLNLPLASEPTNTNDAGSTNRWTGNRAGRPANQGRPNKQRSSERTNKPERER